jgi:hypothetical protein
MALLLGARPLRWAAPFMTCVILLTGSLVGCGPGTSKLTVDKGLARESLAAFLDCWKEGKPVESLESREPPIIGRDTDWEAGGKLAGYTIGEEREIGSNSHIDVTIEVAGRPVQQVTYMVSTTPAITVFREE